MLPAREGQTKIHSRRILVTGATGAIGREIVRSLSQENCVLACYHRHEERARILQEETGCEIIGADVTSPDDVERIFAKPIWAVVHAAGAAHDSLLLRQSPDSWSETLRVNADGAFLIAQAALRSLPRGGRLILMASRVGERGAIGQAAYAASKAVVMALCKTAAREAAELGISVNAICPPFVPSAMSATVSTDKIESLHRQSVWNKAGSANEVVGVVKWLLSDEAQAVSGQIVHCDGRI